MKNPNFMICVMFLLLGLTSCGAGGGGSSVSEDNSLLDTKKGSVDESTLTVMGRAVADGVTQTEIRVVLRTKAGTPMAGVKLKAILSGLENTLCRCTRTDRNGLAICYVASTYPEYKVFQVVRPIEKGVDIHFGETHDPFFLVGEFVSGSTLDSPQLYAQSGALVDSGAIQDSSDRWVLFHMNNISLKGYLP